MSSNGRTYRINFRVRQETAAFYDVTKEIAEDWMAEHNKINRGLSMSLADRYGRDRVNNRWLTTHQAVAFDWDGQMVDGQHRCTMIIKTELTTRLLVVTG